MGTPTHFLRGVIAANNFPCYHSALGQGQCNCFGTLLHRLKTVGRGTPVVQCRATLGKGARELLWFTEALPWAGG